MMRRIKISLILIAAVMTLFISPADAVTIGLDPSSQTVMGRNFYVELTINGLGEFEAPSLGAFDLDISFDPSIVRFRRAEYGDPFFANDQLDPLGTGGTLTQTTKGFGSVNLLETSLVDVETLNDFQLPEFTLAMLFFDALAPGTSPLNILINELGDAEGNSLYDFRDASGSPLTIETASGSVSVSLVPEPSTLLLLSAGLFGSVFLRRKKGKEAGR